MRSFITSSVILFLEGGETGGNSDSPVQDEAPTQETSTFPQLKSDRHRIATDIAASIFKYFYRHKAQIVRPMDIDRLAAELSDFQCAVVRMSSQDKSLCSSVARLPKMMAERANIQLTTHRTKTMWMGSGTGSDLELFLCLAGDVVLELDDHRLPRKSTKYGQKYRRGMELDRPLRQLLTQDGQMAEETVVSLLQNIYELVMSCRGTHQEVKLDTDNGESFDFSKYRMLLSPESADDTLVVLFQLATYLKVCARVPHLHLFCNFCQCELEQLPSAEDREVGIGMDHLIR